MQTKGRALDRDTASTKYRLVDSKWRDSKDIGVVVLLGEYDGPLATGTANNVLQRIPDRMEMGHMMICDRLACSSAVVNMYT
jgi:hypothetical protein